MIGTLTSTGTSGSSTLVGSTLNVPIFQGQITLTTTGSYGTASTLISNTLNIPTSSTGTVTNVSALTIGTTGTDLSSTVATGTTTPLISLQVPTASAINRGVLSSVDWSIFSSKQGALTLTTSGSSGASSLIGNVLNIPQYSAGSFTLYPICQTLSTATSGHKSYWYPKVCSTTASITGIVHYIIGGSDTMRWAIYKNSGSSIPTFSIGTPLANWTLVSTTALTSTITGSQVKVAFISSASVTTGDILLIAFHSHGTTNTIAQNPTGLNDVQIAFSSLNNYGGDTAFPTNIIFTPVAPLNTHLSIDFY